MGHLWIWCGICHQEGRETLMYEPPHDPPHKEPGPQLTPGLDLQLRLSVPLGFIPALRVATLP
jgi:hypothetical protein